MDSLKSMQDITDEEAQENDGKPILLKITDCGGDAEYVLLTSLAITSKSLNLIMFDSSKYCGMSSEETHRKFFYPMVGCYIDILLSRSKNLSIVLIASHYDESLPEHHFLKKQDGVELRAIFEEAEKQIYIRTKEREDHGSKITL